MKIGILRETKNPPDRRVPFSPDEIDFAQKTFENLKFIIQPSPLRCYTDDEYRNKGLVLSEDVSDCDILMGVKEVDKSAFIDNKTYVFFSHVAKKQPYNKGMLQEMMRKKITLIDYEYLTKPNGQRVVAFGYWAGIVGAFNGLRGYGLRTKSFNLKPAHQCHNMIEMNEELSKVELKPVKILITGEGRVSTGALETFKQLNIIKVSVDDFLNKKFDYPVLCQIGPKDYVKHKDGLDFDFNNFIKNPKDYISTFKPFTKVTDIFIACHFWDNNSPKFMTPDDYRESDFNIKMISDVSCDINGPIPSTIRASTIAEPFFDYNPLLEKEELPFSNDTNVTMMTVDNLPGEVARDSSEGFGKALIENVLPSLIGGDNENIINSATILRNGELTEKFAYMADYAAD